MHKTVVSQNKETPNSSLKVGNNSLFRKDFFVNIIGGVKTHHALS